MEYRDKILGIISECGMSGVKAAEIMNMSYDAFRQKKRMAKGHNFTEKNWADLVAWILLFSKRLFD